MTTTPTAQQVLDLVLPENDANAKTVREYLAALARVAWDEKRPFGNSGWHHDLYEPLMRAGWVEGTFDEHGYIRTLDRDAAERLLFQAFDALGARPVVADPLDYDRLADAILAALERRGYFSKLDVDEAVDFNLKVMAKLAQVGTAAQAKEAGDTT